MWHLRQLISEPTLLLCLPTFNPSCGLPGQFLGLWCAHPLLTFSCLFPTQFPITALREIKILQLLKHENVVNLIEICRTKGKLFGSHPHFQMEEMRLID